MNEIAAANWSVKSNGDGTITANNVVNGSVFTGTVDAFNTMVKSQIASVPVEVNLKSGEDVLKIRVASARGLNFRPG